ncbi:unnamed protein product [Triticum turgidum subsp. durum]|uniref:Uncharacterized protein n=1 Tax=Triticum turgidum subsp. durum TaxID=4567 RepID=A0A9R0VX94_TRITD|nr:unnamed protein product [Triticum turgidum subsp. durum]
MGEGVKALLAKPIKLADQVAKQSGSGQCLRPECKELRARAEKLAEAAAAEAIASLAHQSPRCQDLFAQNNAVRHLVGHLAAGTIQEHSRYSVGGSSTRHAAPPPPEHMRSLHSVVLASTPSMLPGISGHSANEPSSSSEGSNGRNNQMHSAAAGRTTTSRVTAPPPSRPQLSSNGSNGRGPRETEDPATKAHMKAMAAKALWKLARGHPGVCKSITESRALLCFARLLEKGDDGAGTHLQYYSAMAIMEITRVAEHKLALRQSAFKPSSPPAKAVAEQLLCIRAPGGQGGHRGAHQGGARHLVQLVYLGDELQIEALILLCYIALHVPESEEVAQAGVLAVLLWASKQPQLVQDLRVERLLPDAKARALEKPCGDHFTITITTPPCYRNSSTTSLSCWIKKAVEVNELNVCRTWRCRAFVDTIRMSDMHAYSHLDPMDTIWTKGVHVYDHLEVVAKVTSRGALAAADGGMQWCYAVCSYR